jgi:hypothetical protein
LFIVIICRYNNTTGKAAEGINQIKRLLFKAL